MKKKVIGAVVFLGAMAMAASSFAATWDTCYIERMGQADSTALLKVTGCGTSSNDGKWLELTTETDRGLAVALTAMSLDKQVKVQADFASATTSGSTKGAISTIYLDR